jgi:uncharacterized protein YuzE
MRWTFDSEADAMYFYLRDVTPARQVEVDPGVIIDLSASDEVVGVEILGPCHVEAIQALEQRFGVAPAEIRAIVYIATRSFLWGPGVVEAGPREVISDASPPGDPIGRVLDLEGDLVGSHS